MSIQDKIKDLEQQISIGFLKKIYRKFIENVCTREPTEKP